MEGTIKDRVIKRKKHRRIRRASLRPRSTKTASAPRFGIPKIALSQGLLKPTRPIPFIVTMSKTKAGMELEAIVQNVRYSQQNLIVPGNPEKSSSMPIIAVPRFGQVLRTPLTLKTDLL
jgi:hypothetical protein